MISARLLSRRAAGWICLQVADCLILKYASECIIHFEDDASTVPFGVKKQTFSFLA